MADASWVALEFGDDVVRVPPGGIIGRLSTAALRLDDSRVSEAHALVSRRGGQLKLLALRRWFEVDGARSSEVALRVGQEIRLAPGVFLRVIEVCIESASTVLRGAAGGPVELESGVYSLLRDADGQVAVTAGFTEPAEGHVWSTGTGWAARIRGGPPVDLSPGVWLHVGDQTLRVVGRPVVPLASTMRDASLDPPVRIVVRHDTVHLFRSDRPPLVLSGVAARIVSEVALLGAPVPWEVPAQEIWRNGPISRARQNWDRNNRTLRKKLAEAQIRTDLVRADGRGNVELFLLPGDELIDES